MFYDAPSSPVGDKTFFPDNPMPLRSVNLSKRKSSDGQKNMTDFVMTFEISEVQRGLVEIGDKHSLCCRLSII